MDLFNSIEFMHNRANIIDMANRGRTTMFNGYSLLLLIFNYLFVIAMCTRMSFKQLILLLMESISTVSTLNSAIWGLLGNIENVQFMQHLIPNYDWCCRVIYWIENLVDSQHDVYTIKVRQQTGRNIGRRDGRNCIHFSSLFTFSKHVSDAFPASDDETVRHST